MPSFKTLQISFSRGLSQLCLLAVSTAFIGCSGPKRQPDSGLSATPEIKDTVAVMSDAYQSPYFVNYAEQADAVLVAIHGFNDYSNAFTGFCAYMAKHGKHCYAYDQRGFGRSEYTGVWPGPGKLQSDLKTWLELVKQRHPNLPLYAVGESMGGAVVMTSMEAHSLPEVEGFILLAPAVWGRRTQPWYQRAALWLTLRVTPGYKPTGKGIKRIGSNNREALRANGRDPLFIKGTRVDAIHGLTNLMDAALSASNNPKVLQRNTLLLYGANDQIIPPNAMCTAVKNINTQENTWHLKHFPEGYHMLTRDLEAEDNFAEIVKWMEGELEENHHMQEFCASKLP